jgi:hypothetical protein
VVSGENGNRAPCGQAEIFIPEEDVLVEQVFSSLQNAQIRAVGPELVFGHLFDSLGLIPYQRRFSGI